MKIVILAGGLGTRISEYTKTTPKPMIKIKGKPIIFHIMKHYAKYGFKDFYIALDDSADDLIIGRGSTVGTTPSIAIDTSDNVTITGDLTVIIPFSVFPFNSRPFNCSRTTPS